MTSVGGGRLMLGPRDPRRIACPKCPAPVGEFCGADGFVHRERSRLAVKLRRYSAADPRQLGFGGIEP